MGELLLFSIGRYDVRFRCKNTRRKPVSSVWLDDNHTNIHRWWQGCGFCLTKYDVTITIFPEIQSWHSALQYSPFYFSPCRILWMLMNTNYVADDKPNWSRNFCRRYPHFTRWIMYPWWRSALMGFLFCSKGVLWLLWFCVSTGKRAYVMRITLTDWRVSSP